MNLSLSALKLMFVTSLLLGLLDTRTAAAVTSQIAAGASHNVALKSDGTVWTWGANGSGQLGNGSTLDSPIPVQVNTLSGITMVAAGGVHSVALKSDGTLWTWGYNGAGELGNGTTTNSSTPVQVLTGVKVIAAGFFHTAAVKNDGSVWTWGNNSSGQLGVGTYTNSTRPVKVSSLTGATALAAGLFHTAAVTSGGIVWCWGSNNFGQLGDGTITDSTIPVKVNELVGATALAVGYYHTVAVKSDGTMWGWGYNGYGQLGNGTWTNSSVPIQLNGLTTVTAIAAGIYHTVALLIDGTAQSWGANESGQLGNGTRVASNTPVTASHLELLTKIAAGSNHTVVLKSDGTVWSWGDNGNGQFGNGATSHSSVPLLVNGLDTVTAVAGGGYHSVAVENNGTVKDWGANSSGQLGTGTHTDSSPPVLAHNIHGVVKIAAGGGHTVAAETGGTVWTWGENSSGQLGEGTTTGSDNPVLVNGLTDVTAVAAGTDHSVALKMDGTVWAWGYNLFGQLGNGTKIDSPTPVSVTGLTDVTAIAAAGNRTVALKGDGTVWFWGIKDNGTMSGYLKPVTMSNLTGITAVATGFYHILALKNDGTVWAWGTNDYGELGNGVLTSSKTVPVMVSGLTGVVAIAAGGWHNLAVKSDGTVWAWGTNGFGELGNDSGTSSSLPVQVNGLSGVVSVAVGDYHSLSLNLDGQVHAWGWNEYGQLGNGYIASLPQQAFINTDTNPPVNGTLTVTASNASISLAWSGFSDAMSGLSGYKLVFATDQYPVNCAVGTTVYSGTDTRFVHYGLTNGNSYYYRICASDKAGNVSSGATAVAKPLSTLGVSVTTTTLPGGVTGAAYNQTLAASGGTAPYSWLVTSGNLPTGLTLGAGGVISGIPTTAGTATFTVQATDKGGLTATQALGIIVIAPPSVTTTTLPGGVTGTAYSQTLAASGGTAPYSWLVTGGNLPSGLILGAGGVISGIPTTAGTATFTVQVTDKGGLTATQTLGIIVTSSIITRSNVALAANGGSATASTTYSPTSYPIAALNNGDRKGLLWGAGGGWNDATSGVYPDWAQITFNGPKTIDEIDIFTVQDVFTSPIEPTATQTFTKYGITAFDIQYWNGSAWVTVPGGSITGNNLVWRRITFPAVTTDRIRVQVNASLAGYSRIVEIEAYTTTGTVINNPPTIILTSPTTGATFTAPAAINLTATAADDDGTVSKVDFYNGATLLSSATTAPYRFTWNNVAVGSYSLTAVAYDNSGAITTSAAATVVVNSAITPPTITTTTLPGGVIGAAYSQTLTASGGTTPYSWSVTGSLPSGLILDNGGVISGIPTTVGTATFTVQVTDKGGLTATQALSANVTSSIITRTNVALAANGGSATASTTYSTTSYPVAALNNGDRKGLNWGAGGGWNDATSGVYPDWAQITFNEPKTIDEVDVFTIQDVLATPIEPTSSQTFTKYGITAFDIQYWNGSGWVTVPGGSITGNNLVWRRITFPAVTTDRIRVQVNASLAGYSRIVEIEAYTTTGIVINNPPTITLTSPTNGATFTAPAAINLTATAADVDGTVSKVDFYNGATLLSSATSAPYSFTWNNVAVGSYSLTAVAYDNSGAVTTSAAATVTVNPASSGARSNVALAANGGIATASTSYSTTSYPVAALNNGDRKGLNWGAGGGWNDATSGVYPDWAQITFNEPKTIDEIDVFTLQDVLATPIEPTSSQIFTKYGITAFDIQYWNGSAWVTVPGGSITGNNLVWQKITFPAITTDRIRVQVNASLAGYSRIVEIEAYSTR